MYYIRLQVGDHDCSCDRETYVLASQYLGLFPSSQITLCSPRLSTGKIEACVHVLKFLGTSAIRTECWNRRLLWRERKTFTVVGVIEFTSKATWTSESKQDLCKTVIEDQKWVSRYCLSSFWTSLIKSWVGKIQWQCVPKKIVKTSL